MFDKPVYPDRYKHWFADGMILRTRSRPRAVRRSSFEGQLRKIKYWLLRKINGSALGSNKDDVWMETCLSLTAA